jgi:uncharacterized Zn finger protein (UPF0148 family)
MDNVYTCVCGNQTWIILDGTVRCTMCHEDYAVQLTPVNEFNTKVMEQLEEEEV